jgi:hypothetical protein
MATKSEFIEQMQDLVVDIIEANIEKDLPDRDGIDWMVQGIADRVFDEIASPGLGSGHDVLTSITNLIASEASSEVFTFVAVSSKFPVSTAWIDDTGAGAWRAAHADIRIEPVSITQIRILNSTGSDIPAGRVKLSVVG